MNPDLTYLYNIVKSASKELIKINTIITEKPKNKTKKNLFKKNFFKKNFFKKVLKNEKTTINLNICIIYNGKKG